MRRIIVAIVAVTASILAIAGIVSTVMIGDTLKDIAHRMKSCESGRSGNT